MNNAIIFASYIPNNKSLWVGIEILDKLVSLFNNYDIYIGINPSCDEWIEVIENYKDKLNIYYEVTPYNLIIDSDASAFQTALNLYKKINITHKLVWFIHTKGVTSNCHEFRHIIYRIFLDKKNEIENMFIENKNLGLFSPYMYKINGSIWDNYIEYNLRSILIGDKFKIATNISCYYTFYILNGKIIKDFINDVDIIFFNENLLNLGIEHKFDRYFFERDFPMIAEKYNYKTYPNDHSWCEKYT